MTSPRLVALLLLVLDAIATVFVFNVVAHLRGVLQGNPAFTALLAPGIALIFAVYLIDGYRARTDMLSVDYTSHHSIALLSAMLGTLLLTFAFLPAGYELQSSRAVIVLSFLSLIPLSLAYRRLIYLRFTARRGQRTIIFLGDIASCHAFRTECQKMSMAQPLALSVMTTESIPPFAPAGTEQIRTFAEVLHDVDEGRLEAEAIVLRETARELPPEVSRKLVELYFAGIPTFTLELFHQVYWQKIPLYRLNQTWLFQEGFEIAREPAFERLKRTSDIGFALLGLTLGAPVLLLAACAIWLDDRGPVFFAQTRIGKNHQPFRLLKLRTMRQATGPAKPYTEADDPRITRVGRLLRASRLDEVPQLWNVLRGEMSLIGPRAEWDRLVLIYENEIPCYHFRHLVKPGITGWAQVNYPYGANLEDTERKLEYDLYYIRHFSFLLDASIVLKTIHIMLFGKGR